ncbi:MAG: hypothetical protein ACYDES_03605 [Acidimicrobiales bacterium]
MRARGRKLRRAGAVIGAKPIGITPTALVADLRSTNSLAGVAGQHDISSRTVISDLVNAADGRIHLAVTDGRLTAPEASTLEAGLPGRIAMIANHAF